MAAASTSKVFLPLFYILFCFIYFLKWIEKLNWLVVCLTNPNAVEKKLSFFDQNALLVSITFPFLKIILHCIQKSRLWHDLVRLIGTADSKLACHTFVTPRAGEEIKACTYWLVGKKGDENHFTHKRWVTDVFYRADLNGTPLEFSTAQIHHMCVDSSNTGY